jgi:hypothetical protein
VTERRFRRRLGVTAIVAVAAVATFAVVGGTGLAGGLAKPFKSQYGPGGQYQGKVTICHKGWVTLRIAFAAWPAHLNRHDDTMGACSAAAVKAGKLKAAKQKAAKQEAKAAKAAAKAEKKAKHASAKGQEVTVDETTASGTAGPPPGRGNGNGQGNGNGNGNGQGNAKKG